MKLLLQELICTTDYQLCALDIGERAVLEKAVQPLLTHHPQIHLGPCVLV